MIARLQKFQKALDPQALLSKNNYEGKTSIRTVPSRKLSAAVRAVASGTSNSASRGVKVYR